MSYYIDDWKDIKDKKRTRSLFLAEGASEVGLIEAILKDAEENEEECTILCFKGVNRLAHQSDALAKLIGAHLRVEALDAVALVADSETDPSGRINAVLSCAKAFFFRKCDRSDQTATVTILPVTSALTEAPLLRLTVEPSETNGLQKRSQIMIDKASTTQRDKVGSTFGCLDSETMLSVTRRLAVFLGIA